MNESDIETLLSGLSPRGPSPALERRVAHELELDQQWLRQPLRRSAARWMMPALWAGAGAAAALAVMTLVQPETPAAPRVAVNFQTPGLLPAGTIREIVRTEDEGIAFNEASQTHEQRVRLYSLERQAWIDPRDGAHITVEMPREESFVLPVSYQ
ncbi:MAG TPA: hypothetical protein DIT64_07965 [Verrucomicrobiales bacterium]|nr:hypothetical protein [Verrucomicrobiales bacterium]